MHAHGGRGTVRRQARHRKNLATVSNGRTSEKRCQSSDFRGENEGPSGSLFLSGALPANDSFRHVHFDWDFNGRV